MKERGGAVTGALILLAAVACVAVLAYGIHAQLEAAAAWHAWAAQHCKMVGHMDGDTDITVAPVVIGKGGVAVGVTDTPDKTAYKCDDGVTYWRND